MSKFITSYDVFGKPYKVPINQLTWRPAAYAIVIHDDKILLTKQRKAYHLPGGGIELGEMPADGVIRETREETGLIVENPQLIDHISGFFSAASSLDPTESTNHFHSILLYYRCDLVGGELSTAGFDEEEKLIGELAEWIPLSQLDDITAGSTIDWRQVVKNQLSVSN